LRKVTLEHLTRQEAALREFLEKYPNAPQTIDARLRLAQVYAVRGDFSENPQDGQMANRILREGMAAAPAERRVDFEFASISLQLRRFGTPGGPDRETLRAQSQMFAGRYPSDRRTAPLLTEVARLYDNQPQRKGELLRLALASAQTPDIRARIGDDLRRLGFLGHTVEIKGTALSGQMVDLTAHRGKVAIVYFFAAWSTPSVAGLEEVEALRRTFAPMGVVVLGVSVDEDRMRLAELLKEHGINWPVIYDGKGWQSPLVRSLAINALPTLWLFDRQGRLRTLNAQNGADPLVRALLKEAR